MGRRSQHTAEELRALILEATKRIVDDGGMSRLSAREIAREIGYAPGTLYNMYENLDEILLMVEAGVLAELEQHLERDLLGLSGAPAIRRFAESYVAFAHARPRLWNLLNDHQLGPETSMPRWYLDQLYAPGARLALHVSEIVQSDPSSLPDQLATTLWHAIHGMTLLSTCGKFGRVDAGAARERVLAMVELFVIGVPTAKSAVKPRAGKQQSSTKVATKSPR